MISQSIRELIDAQTKHQQAVDNFDGDDFNYFHHKEIVMLQQAEQNLERVINELIDSRVKKLLSFHKN